MKVTKWVEVETEVTINVSASDIASALAGEADTVGGAMMCLNSVACFMNGLTDEVIAQMKDGPRAFVYDFLQRQAQRFAPPAP